MNNALWSLMQAYNQRLPAVRPEFYNGWDPHADPQMLLTPDESPPALNDKNILHPDDLPWPSPNFGAPPRQEFSALSRLMGMG